MGKYYSPSGNFEVWEIKPDGYYTEEEWAELHPAPAPPEPTKAEKLAILENQYEQDSAELEKYFTKAYIANDLDTMTELRLEISDLEAEYEAQRAEILEG